jgi:PAS domain S-box-containing protein
MPFDYDANFNTSLRVTTQFRESPQAQKPTPRMISTAAPPAVTGNRLRALVVEPDAAVRLRVIGLLQRQGCDVHACEDLPGASSLYDGHDIIIASVNGDCEDLSGFVERIRATSGDEQPFILGLPGGSGVRLPSRAAEWGMNDLLTWPVDTEHLTTRISAIVRQCAARPRPGLAEAPDGGWDSPATAMLLEQLPSAVAILDREMRYLSANQRWRREFQIQGLQVIGQCHFDLFPDLHPAWRELYERCLAGHRERTDDDLFIRTDGTQDWVRWDIQPWSDASTGRTGGLILTCSIVSADVRDQATFSFEQDLANTLLHSPLAPVVLVDTAGRILRCNGAARNLAVPASLQDGHTFFWNALTCSRRRDAARQRLLDLLKTAAAPGGVWPAPGGPALTLPARPGQQPGIAWTAFPHRRAGGALEGLLLIGFPPAALSPPDMIEEPAPTPGFPGPVPDEMCGVDYRRLAEAAPFGMIVLNEDAAVLYANPQHRAVLGFSITECGGITAWLERACAADEEFKRRALDEWWERVWRKRASWTCSLRTAEGMLKEIEFRPTALADHKLLLTVLDVTDARLEEQALRASETRYRGLFQNCASGVAVLNASGNITESNAALEELTGLSRGELRRAGLSAFLSESDAARVRSAVAGGDSPGREIPVRLKTKSGEEIPAGLSWSVVRNAEGVIVYTACLVHPGVQLPSAAAPGWQGADWSRTVPDWVLLLDGFGRIVEHSDARDFAGIVPREALSGRTLEETVPAIADLLPVDVMIERLRENPGAETRCEFNTVLAPGGKPHFIEARMLALTPPGGESRFGLVLRDLTALAGRQAPSAGPLPWLRNLGTAIILTNERGRITGINPAAEQLLGWPAAALEGSGLYRIFRPDSPKEFSDEISAELGRSRSWRARTEFTRQDGVKGNCDVELVPAHDEISGLRGFVAVLRPVAAEPVAESAPESAPASSPVVSGRPAVTLHRARNDLQVLSSLLTLQAERAEGDVRTALLAGKDRLNAVAIVYRLINSEDDTVDFHRYASELGRMLLETRKVPMDRIKLEVSADSVRLPQKTAITLGLIVEELLAAAIAESFPGGSTGTIRISLTTGSGEGILIVRDNGTLLTDALRERRLGSFSWQMVQTLAEPIGGVVTLLSDLENQVRLRFRLQPQS